MSQMVTPYMGPPPAQGNRDLHFQNYRDDVIAKMRLPNYEWGGMDHPYTPSPDRQYYKNTNKYLNLPASQFSMNDRERQEEVDNFYIVCQLHRDQYRDHTNTLHPLDYFKRSEYQYQCPTDPTTSYLKTPINYMKYKQPIVFPLTLERTINAPWLPDRVLTGIYSRSSDSRYKQ